MANRKSSKQLEQFVGKPFHITVGVATSQALNIDSDLRLLRTALLYGDKVKICSYTIGYLNSMFEFSNSLEGFLDGMERSSLFVKDEAQRAIDQQKLAYYRFLIRKKRRDKDELLALSRLKSKAVKFQDGLREQYPAITRKEEFEGIQRAIKTGLLELHAYESFSYETLANSLTPDKNGNIPSNEFVYEEFIKTLSETLQNRATYPLFDDAAGSLAINRMNPDGELPSLSEVRIAQAKHSATAANMFEQLPDFGLTSIDSILDIRKELRPYLHPFRSGIKSYSTKIQSAPWSKDFTAEADELFIREVIPALLALEDSIKTNRSLIKEMKDAKSIIGYVTGAGSSVLSCFVDDYAALPLYAKIAFGLTTAMVTPLLQWALNQIQPNPEIKRHNLYFYYRLKKKIERN